MKSILIIFLSLLSIKNFAQHKIDLFVYSDYMGPKIDFVAEISGEEITYQSFRLDESLNKKVLRNYSDFTYGRYILNCNKLSAGFSNINNYGLKRMGRITINRTKPFTLKYFAQENGPSKGTWTGVVKSTTNGSSSTKCKVINLNQFDGSLNQYGRMYFYKNVQCDGYYKVYVNDELVGKLNCLIVDVNKFRRYKGLCDGFYIPTPHNLVSKQYQYGDYQIKTIFIRNDGGKDIETSNVKLNKPCQIVLKE